MNAYDFLNLSPSEFEVLVRDLLQAEFSTHIESFAEGPDSGIDLRYEISPGRAAIVQCKRFSSFSNLYQKLMLEKDKVKRLHPDKYVLVTSVDLTPPQKDKIKTLFQPYIASASDILGNADINNLLERHPEILQSHYKLYLSSIHILQKLVNAKIYNQTRFEEAEIKNTLQTYVQNGSFSEALSILKEHKIVLISGHPGVGKTTLGRMLIYYLLVNGFDEFANISDSISEGITGYNEGRKIVFWFDDFLGTNFLNQKKLTVNEDNRLLNFIASIKRSNDNVLILTTREYILQQAQQVYEKLDDRQLQLSKCVVDIGKYTLVIKAQILSNHLYFHKIPANYIHELLKNDFYFDLVEHQNFNPRIVELIIDKGEWSTVPAYAFPSLLKEAFDNPQRIWLKIYENQISMFSRVALAILSTFSGGIYLNDFEAAIGAFIKKNKDSYGILFNKFEFGNSVKVLENTFIETTTDDNGSLSINFQNPSIRDFLVNYLSARENKSLLKDIIESAVSLDQLTSNITNQQIPEDDDLPFKMAARIFVDADLVRIIKYKIIGEYHALRSFRVSQYDSDGNFGFTTYYAAQETFPKLLILTTDALYSNTVDDYHSFLVEEMQSSLDFSYLDYSSRHAFIRLFEILHDFLQFNEEKLVYNFGRNISYLTDWSLLLRLKKILPAGVDSFKKDVKVFNERYQALIDYEKNAKNSGVLNYTINEWINIGKELEFNVTPEINFLREKQIRKPELEYDAFADLALPVTTALRHDDYGERDKIRRIFNGLIDSLDK